MVPALVTASWRDPGRGVSSSLARSQLMPGPQLGEEVGGVAAGEHVECRLEHRPAEFLIRSRPAHQVEQVVGGRWCADHRGHQLLGQHVDGVGGDAGRLHPPLRHLLGDHGGHQEVAPVLGKHPRPGDAVHLVARIGPTRCRPEATEVGASTWRHQIDGPHIDAELQRRGGNHRLQLASFQCLLDLEALFTGDRAVVGPSHLRRQPGC